jgi:hypothetical protein
MKLAKALKVKNRLVGELNQLKVELQRENSRRNDNPSKVDCKSLYAEIEAKRDSLIALKAAICSANAGSPNKDAGIYQKIDKMSELKSFINFLAGLPKREGEELTLIGANREKLTYQWTAFINQERADALTKELQLEVNKLQDDVDEYNAVTEVK